MATEVIVSSLGIAIDEVTVASIVKNEGDEVQENEVVATVESEKASFEVVSPIQGVILKIYAQEGEAFKVGSVLALVGNRDESSLSEFAGKPAKNNDEQKDEQKQENHRRQKIYPAAKALLQEHDIDISSVVGTGPAGVITKQDVLKAIEAKTIQVVETDSAKGNPWEERMPMSPVRQSIAKNMLLSKQTAADVTTLLEVNMTKLRELRKQIKDETGENISTVSFVCKAITEEIKEFPALNSSIEGTTIVYKKYVNIGVGVARDKGLVVPVIKNTQEKTLLEIDRELKRLVDISREGKITPEVMSEGTITLSNAGAYGALIATPIINQPESAVVWMGAIVKRPVIVDDQIKIGQMMYLCLTYDHRVTDGAVAAQFLVKIKELLENPLKLLFG